LFRVRLAPHEKEREDGEDVDDARELMVVLVEDRRAVQVVLVEGLEAMVQRGGGVEDDQGFVFAENIAQ